MAKKNKKGTGSSTQLLSKEQINKQKLVAEFFSSRNCNTLFEKLKAAEEYCKHLKHFFKILRELKEYQQIITVYKKPKSFDSVIQLDNNKQLSKLVSGVKNQAILVAIEAGGYIRKTTTPNTSEFFQNLELLLNSFAKLHNEEFINKKEELLKPFYN
jgi:hypothetical protein